MQLDKILNITVKEKIGEVIYTTSLRLGENENGIIKWTDLSDSDKEYIDSLWNLNFDKT